ncbi:hypothetical protein MLD38_020778 [Melastoma candidum]|uniref:Uncharacterized protein n=1 Tax=Melastoma candidum TaxID=119954 RepID=A0ACB9QDX5_9MYRT|nr:hypothetical protein MLD38_020778 [Melastoma candidum]
MTHDFWVGLWLRTGGDMCVEAVDEGLNHLDSRESGVTSVEGDGRLSEDGDARSEMMATGMGKKNGSSGSGKRVHSQRSDNDPVSLDWKKNRCVVNYAVDDEAFSVVGESVGERNLSSDDCDSSSFSGMLGWLSQVAIDPCDGKLGSLPEWSKWKSFGGQEMWKQALIAREALFIKRSDGVDSNWQKHPRMHPYMYDDQSGYSYKLRERLKCKEKPTWKGSAHGTASSESTSSGAQRNEDGSLSASVFWTDENGDDNGTSDSSTVGSPFFNRRRQRILLGSRYQAEVPKWNGVKFESDSKWLGTQIWPLKKSERRSLIERDPIGKGRQDSCGCVIRGSVDCIRFHIAEKRFKLKVELGSAFFFWRFDKMGEEAVLPWTKQDKDKFVDIIKLNPASELKCFWDELRKGFPEKRTEELVSYYYNVFLLKRREHQNRHSPFEITSDDDESESSLTVKWVAGNQDDQLSNSIFYSPAKPKPKTR